MKAVSPFFHPDFLNFKMMPYEALIRDVRMKWLMGELSNLYMFSL